MEYTKKHRSGSAPENRYSDSLIPSSSAQVPNSILCDVMAGKKRATSEMMGHRENLAASVTAKMNRAFGMDFSNVQLYRSDAMAGTGTEGLAQGNKIVLSKDINLNTMAGQAVLGHELSHLRAQSFGVGLGHSGLYNNTSLEQQADTEGMMAARGLSLNGSSLGMETAPGMQGLSSLTPLGAGMGPSAGAPMQAKSNKKNAPADQRQPVDIQPDILDQEGVTGNNALLPESPGAHVTAKPEKEAKPPGYSIAKKFFGAVFGGLGRGIQSVGAGLNLATGGHLFGSLYNKLSWKGGAGQAIGKALLAPISMVTNLPSTIVSAIGGMSTKFGKHLWNHDWGKKESSGKKNQEENAPSQLEYNKREDNYTNYNTFDLLFAGGTNLSNRFINPGDSDKKSWISEIAKRNHQKLFKRSTKWNPMLRDELANEEEAPDEIAEDLLSEDEED